MLYSNEKQGTNSFRGKVWRLPNSYWRACNYNGQQCTYKLYNEALRFSQKGKPLNEDQGKQCSKCGSGDAMTWAPSGKTLCKSCRGLQDESVVNEATYAAGEKVQIARASGPYSNKKGVVVSQSAAKNKKTVQSQDVNWSKDVAVQLDGGKLIVIAKARVQKISDLPHRTENVSEGLNNDMGAWLKRQTTARAGKGLSPKFYQWFSKVDQHGQNPSLKEKQWAVKQLQDNVPHDALGKFWVEARLRSKNSRVIEPIIKAAMEGQKAGLGQAHHGPTRIGGGISDADDPKQSNRGALPKWARDPKYAKKQYTDKFKD